MKTLCRVRRCGTPIGHPPHLWRDGTNERFVYRCDGGSDAEDRDYEETA